ncbi:hypothetical protein ACWEIJ_43400 [Lentzea sp. NPDC004789]
MTAPDEPEAPPPYKAAAPRAQYFKAVLQMGVALVAVSILLFRVVFMHWGDSVGHIREDVFDTIGLALAIAAAIELAYTLFTHGPDEALDPLMLGLSAALVLQLGKAENFQWSQALAALLYIVGLVALFMVRRHLTDEHQPAHWSAWDWWRGRTDRGEATSRHGGSP